MKNAYIHMGYPRCGSTFVAKHIFSNVENIHYLGKPFNHNVQLIIDSITKLSKDKFYKANIDLNFLKKIDKDILISFEDLLDVIQVKFNYKENYKDIFFNRIKYVDYIFSSLNYKTKFIINIRDQEEILESIFKYKFGFFRENNLYNFLDLYNSDKEILNFFKYDEFIQKLITLLQKESDDFLILSFNEFKNDPDSYVSKLLNFLNRKLNINTKINQKFKLKENKSIAGYVKIKKGWRRKITKIYFLNLYLNKFEFYKKIKKKKKTKQLIFLIKKFAKKENYIKYNKKFINSDESTFLKNFFEDDTKKLKIRKIYLK